MADFFAFINRSAFLFPELLKLIVLLVAFIGINFLINYLRHNLLLKAQTKKQRSNIEMFSRILKYSLFAIFVLFALFTFSGSWTGLGLSLGLLSAAIGFALQKPITSIAAWIMVVFRRPFAIGDRIVIGTLKGDVFDITLTHISLHEVGGLAHGEERTGRDILVPNYLLFEQHIVNYSLEDDYVLGQIVISVTYESDLNKALELCIAAAKYHTKTYLKEVKNLPTTRLAFGPSGVDITLRFFVPFFVMSEVTTTITKEIYDRIQGRKDVSFAYPHTEIIFKNQKK